MTALNPVFNSNSFLEYRVNDIDHNTLKSSFAVFPCLIEEPVSEVSFLILQRDFAVTPLPVARIMSSPGSQHGESE